MAEQRVALAQKLATEAQRLIEWYGTPSRPQRELSDAEYAELLDSFSAMDLHLSDAFRNDFINTLLKRFKYVRVVNNPSARDKYFSEAVRGMADYFLVADATTRKGFAVILAHARRPLSIKLVAAS